MPDPLAGGRRVEPVRCFLFTKLCRQACRFLREGEIETIAHVAEPLEPAGDVAVRQVARNQLQEFVDVAPEPDVSQIAVSRSSDGAHRVLQNSGDVRHIRSSSLRRARRSRLTRTSSSSIRWLVRRMCSSRATARSSSRTLVFAETPPTPIFTMTLYEHMYVVSRSSASR